MKTKLLTLALALAFMVPMSVNADDTATDTTINTEIKAELDALKTLGQELRAQIDAGEITLDEARATWREEMEKVRELKHEYFSERLEDARVRYEGLAENNPELAEKIKERFETMRTEREADMKERQALRDSLAAGEISGDEFREQMKGLRNELRENRRERANDWKEWRQERSEGEGLGLMKREGAGMGVKEGTKLGGRQ